MTKRKASSAEAFLFCILSLHNFINITTAFSCRERSCFFAYSLPHAAVVVAVADAVRREKLFYRETDAAEEGTGVILGNASRAFFFRQTVVISWDKKLGISF